MTAGRTGVTFYGLGRSQNSPIYAGIDFTPRVEYNKNVEYRQSCRSLERILSGRA